MMKVRELIGILGQASDLDAEVELCVSDDYYNGPITGTGEYERKEGYVRGRTEYVAGNIFIIEGQ